MSQFLSQKPGKSSDQYMYVNTYISRYSPTTCLPKTLKTLAYSASTESGDVIDLHTFYSCPVIRDSSGTFKMMCDIQ